MEIDAPGAKWNSPGALPVSTKVGLMVWRGHTGAGMIHAHEMARDGRCAFITTISKRGRPAAPGPARAFMAAISENTPHFMAACDETDPVAVECLSEWAPPVETELIMDDWEEPNADMMIADIKSEMDTMSPAQMQGSVEALQMVKMQNLASQRDTKKMLQQKAFLADKDFLQQRVLQ